MRTERSEVRAKTTEGQYFPVRLELARLVSSLLYGTRTMLSKTKNTQLLTVSTETVRMAKSRPRKNQSERSDLPCHIIKENSLTDYIISSKILLVVTFAIFCRSIQVFIGLGFPYEGPAPLEAIAQGCVFLNAKVTCELTVRRKSREIQFSYSAMIHCWRSHGRQGIRDGAVVRALASHQCPINRLPSAFDCCPAS